MIDRPAFEVAAELIATEQFPSEVGQAIGPYKVLGQIGRGGMGEVYLAQDSRLGRRVALKLLPSHFTTDKDRLRRFKQEARAASALNHPNIITIHEVGQVEDTHFIATEFVEGRTLRSFIEGGKIEIADALDVAVQVASALQTAHEAGIVHRDIKPENIMLRPDGYVKVLDFGLAKLTERGEESVSGQQSELSTKTGVVMGTIKYMSPEQARGEKVDHRTDIFSLGVVLYETVTGRAPFGGETASHTIVAILEREPKPIAEYVDAAPGELQRVVDKALVKNREERYQTAAELLDDLQEIRYELQVQAHQGLGVASSASDSREKDAGGVRVTNLDDYSTAPQNEPLVQPRSSSVEYIVREIEQHKKVAAASLILILLGCIGIYFLLKPYKPTNNTGSPLSKTISSLAVLPFANANPDPSAEFLSDGMSESLINTLSQLSQLKVTARTTAFRYKGKEVDPQAIGRDLKVDAVLTGKVVQQGDSLLVQADLIRTSDGAQIWGQRYSRRMSDILTVQEELARQISDKLRVKISGEEETLLAKHHTEKPEAYKEYLKGRFYVDRHSDEGGRRAIEQFNKAIAIDPNYALAYSGLADINVFISDTTIPPREAMPKAKAAAMKALELDTTLAEAHASYGLVLWRYEYNWQEAEQELKRAIELNPNNAWSHFIYCDYLRSAGRHEEALAEARKALEIEPLSLIYNRTVGYYLAELGQYEEAIRQLQKTLELDPTFAFAHAGLGEGVKFFV